MSRTLVAVPAGGFWDVPQVARYLSVSRSWVWAQCRERRGLPFINLGTEASPIYRFDPAAVQSWARARSAAVSSSAELGA